MGEAGDAHRTLKMSPEAESALGGHCADLPGRVWGIRAPTGTRVGPPHSSEHMQWTGPRALSYGR